MTILLTGGTGKTSSRIAPLLQKQGTPAILASRSGSAPAGFTGCRFDWLDDTTYGNPFELASDITAMYMVAPMASDMLSATKPFTDYAIGKGVKRFVLLSSSAIELGGPAHGKVHEYLVEKKVDYGVLRPTWFMENFSENQHLACTRDEGKIYTASGKAKLPFVAAADIAAVAVHLLTDPKPHNKDYVILGPELLSFDDAAKVLSEALNKQITHVSLAEDEQAKWLESKGLPSGHAQMLAGLDAHWIAVGKEERLNSVVKDVTGREPMGFREFVEENKHVWQ